MGENLQDQPNVEIVYSGKRNISNSATPYVTYATVNDYFGDSVSSVSIKTKDNLNSWAATVASANNNSIPVAALEYLFSVQYDLLFGQNISSAELLTAGAENFLASAFWTLIPFSRGSVHIESSDPLAYPAINPNFFLIDFDGQVMIAVSKLIRKFWATKPISDLVLEEITPGFEGVPLNASDSQWLAWIKSSCGFGIK